MKQELGKKMFSFLSWIEDFLLIFENLRLWMLIAHRRSILYLRRRRRRSRRSLRVRLLMLMRRQTSLRMTEMLLMRSRLNVIVLRQSCHTGHPTRSSRQVLALLRNPRHVWIVMTRRRSCRYRVTCLGMSLHSVVHLT